MEVRIRIRIRIRVGSRAHYKKVSGKFSKKKNTRSIANAVFH
jgi:uncharacterized small protein (DUF1192 family)